MNNSSSPENYFLSHPPRHVPMMLALRVKFGGFANQFGWFFFGFGMIFFWVFAMQADLTSWRFWGSNPEAQGVIEDARDTNYSEGDRQVVEYRYSFEDGRGEVYFGTAFANTGRFSPGDKITVEYIAGDPETSRVEGMKRKPFGMGVLFVTIFPFIGTIFISFGRRHGRKGVRLLRDGNMTTGRLVNKVRTNTKINDRTVYKMTFDFVAEDRQTYQAEAKTHIPEKLEDEAEERILYAPWDPQFAVVFDDLPGAPTIEAGRLVASGKGQLIRSIFPLIIPGISILGHGSYFLFAYLL